MMNGRKWRNLQLSKTEKEEFANRLSGCFVILCLVVIFIIIIIL